MTQRQTLFEIKIITDDDCGMYRMGEIDTLTDEKVEKYISIYGEYGYEQLKEFATKVLSQAFDYISRERASSASLGATEKSN